MRSTFSLCATSLALVLLSMPALGQQPLPSATSAEQDAGAITGEMQVTVGGTTYRVPYSVGPGADADIAAEADNEALYQGDILLGPLAKVAAVEGTVSLQSLDRDILFGLALRDLDARWPDGHMRYRISPDLPRPERVRQAILAWEAATKVVSFEEIATADGNYVEFVAGGGCSSAVGMVGGRQVIRLGPNCTTGNTVHEIGHALGLHHEQARSDRGAHVIVFTSNILSGAEGNFLQDPTNFEDVGPYCHGSIMHYGAFAFASDPNRKTIETVPAGIPIGQRAGLAECDVETIETIYGFADPVTAVFEGELELFPDGCQAQGLCYLRNDLTFTDPRNVGWRAGKWIEGEPVTPETGTTDGASIPDWAQPIIGDPFSDEYLLAAVLHDHYCYKENHVRGWRQTHRMFYDALKALGLGFPKAEIMYGAVFLGGPRWIDLVPGENCGPNCIYDAIGDNAALHRAGDDVELKRDATYGSPEFLEALARIEAAIEADPGITPRQIEALVQAEQPEDFFLGYPDRYVVGGEDDPVLDAE